LPRVTSSIARYHSRFKLIERAAVALLEDRAPASGGEARWIRDTRLDQRSQGVVIPVETQASVNFVAREAQNVRRRRCVGKSFWLAFDLAGAMRAKSSGEHMPTVVTKADLVDRAAKAGNLSRSAAGEAVNAVFDAIVTEVSKGKRVTVVGFGTFLPRKRKARAGRSPVNGKEIKIAAKTVPAFAAGQGFRNAVDRR